MTSGEGEAPKMHRTRSWQLEIPAYYVENSLFLESASHLSLPAGLHQLFVEWHLQTTGSFFPHQPYRYVAIMWDPSMSRDVKGAISFLVFYLPGLGLTAGPLAGSFFPGL